MKEHVDQVTLVIDEAHVAESVEQLRELKEAGDVFSYRIVDDVRGPILAKVTLPADRKPNLPGEELADVTPTENIRGGKRLKK